MPKNTLPCVGDRIEATSLISYTLDEFEDNPLIVESGGQGTVTTVDEASGVILVDWDNDQSKNIKKAINVYLGATDFKIV